MLIIEQERERIEIHFDSRAEAVTFSSNGEYLFSGGSEQEVQVWRVEDGTRTATMPTKGYMLCLAVSKDGKLIAAGANSAVYVWDAETHERVLEHELDSSEVNCVDFSPDGSRLVWACDNEAAVWDIGTRKQLQTLHHEDRVKAAKYSPQGDRIATATKQSVRVFDSSDGRLLWDIKISVISYYNTALLWSNLNNHLFVASASQITEIEESTASIVSEWEVFDTGFYSRIAQPSHGEFIAHATKSTISFWDTVTRTQLGLFQSPEEIDSIAFSPDDRFIAVSGGSNGNIVIESLSRINVSRTYFWIMACSNGSTVLDIHRKTRRKPAAFDLVRPRRQPIRVHPSKSIVLTVGLTHDSLRPLGRT